jgi:hypothetical protein
MPGPLLSSLLSPVPGIAAAGPLAFSTAGDAADGFLFGGDIASLQRWVLVYLALSSLVFVGVWVVGYLRRR